jgi:hypothetical protein
VANVPTNFGQFVNELFTTSPTPTANGNAGPATQSQGPQPQVNANLPAALPAAYMRRTANHPDLQGRLNREAGTPAARTGLQPNTHIAQPAPSFTNETQRRPRGPNVTGPVQTRAMIHQGTPLLASQAALSSAVNDNDHAEIASLGQTLRNHGASCNSEDIAWLHLKGMILQIAGDRT